MNYLDLDCEVRFKGKLIGNDWLGLVKYRIYANEEDYITLYGLIFLKFAFYVKFPANLMNCLERRAS